MSEFFEAQFVFVDLFDRFVEKKLAANQRMSLQVRNLERKDKQELAEIRKLAKQLKKDLAANAHAAQSGASLCKADR